jgi:hypothetical protein
MGLLQDFMAFMYVPVINEELDRFEVEFKKNCREKAQMRTGTIILDSTWPNNSRSEGIRIHCLLFINTTL